MMATRANTIFGLGGKVGDEGVASSLIGSQTAQVEPAFWGNCLSSLVYYQMENPLYASAQIRWLRGPVNKCHTGSVSCDTANSPPRFKRIHKPLYTRILPLKKTTLNFSAQTLDEASELCGSFDYSTRLRAVLGWRNAIERSPSWQTLPRADQRLSRWIRMDRLRSISPTAMNSSLLCAWAISPGPNTTEGMPADS